MDDEIHLRSGQGKDVFAVQGPSQKKSVLSLPVPIETVCPYELLIERFDRFGRVKGAAVIGVVDRRSPGVGEQPPVTDLVEKIRPRRQSEERKRKEKKSRRGDGIPGKPRRGLPREKQPRQNRRQRRQNDKIRRSEGIETVFVDPEKTEYQQKKKDPVEEMPGDSSDRAYGLCESEGRDGEGGPDGEGEEQPAEKSGSRFLETREKGLVWDREEPPVMKGRHGADNGAVRDKNLKGSEELRG